jgi:hypothetical protein
MRERVHERFAAADSVDVERRGLPSCPRVKHVLLLRSKTVRFFQKPKLLRNIGDHVRHKTSDNKPTYTRHQDGARGKISAAS